MFDVDFLAIAASAVAAFVISTVWYIVFAAHHTALSPAAADAAAAGATPPPWKIAIELVRSAVVASVVAALAGLIGVRDLPAVLVLAVALWVAFPVVLLTGSVIWENVPPKLAAIHAGDWLVKLVVIGLIVFVLR